MSQARTEALAAVDEALNRLYEVVDAETDEPFGGVQTAWVAVSARVRFEDDGSSSTGVRLYMPETMPDWQQMGLLHAAIVMLDDDFGSEAI